MTAPYGASPEEWSHWDLGLGLTEDLLPVVCQPGLPINPTSQLKSYGKVPSRFDREGRVVGFPGWTQHRASGEAISRWATDDRLGICLQTRTLKALDLDITDGDYVKKIIWRVSEVLGFDFPLRSRADSPKCLLLINLPGDYPKQTLQTPHGVIEFLASGQQCLISGTHKDGARYTWGASLPLIFPKVDETQFRSLQQQLADFTQTQWSEGRLRPVRTRGAAPDVTDDVVRFLQTNGLALTSSPDRIDVSCPWAAQHTTDSDVSSTSYFPSGTGGFETGSYRCLHAHCVDRSTAEFLNAIGYFDDGFTACPDIVRTDAALTSLIGTEGPVTVPAHPLTVPHFDRDKSGKIKPHLTNVVLALSDPEFCHVRLGRDAFLDQIVVGDAARSVPFQDDDYGQLLLTLRQRGFGPGDIPIETLRRGVSYVARHASFDSAINWLRALPMWDGLPRVEHFCHEYLGAADTPYHRAVSRYWWTAHAGRVLAAPIQADMAIILVSGQGTGKSSAIKAMVPHPSQYIALSFNTPDEEQARLMRGTLVGELAELSGLKGRDAETTKAWISCTTDTLRQLYKEFTYQLPRRLVLVGTSNRDDFAGDETGHRRLLPVRVGEQQDREAIARDREQLWAEAAVLFDAQGILWTEAERLAPTEHQLYEPSDPSYELVSTWLTSKDPFTGQRPCDEEYVTIHAVLEHGMRIAPQQFSLNAMHRAGRILRACGYVHRNVRQHGVVVRLWYKL